MAKNHRTTAWKIPQELPPTITRVGAYARVSTLNGQDPEMQLRDLREYACRRGWTIVEEYVDQGVSGSKETRPALTRLMADACQRRFDAVLVWKVDRFGRSLKHLVNALAELGALGVAFVSLRDNLDLSTPSGRLMFQIIGGIAEFERALIQERVKAGLRNARAKGKRLGRPRVVVDSTRIGSLRAQGRSWAETKTEVGVRAKEQRKGQFLRRQWPDYSHILVRIACLIRKPCQFLTGAASGGSSVGQMRSCHSTQ